MHVMFMAQVYAPEDVSAAVLITELSTDLVKRGHQVTMVTCAPNYPYGRVYPSYRNRLYQAEWLDGVRVVRTWSYISSRKSFWRRILNYGSYSATAFYGGLAAGKPDVLVNYSPPLPLGLSAWLLSRLWRIPWVLQIEDLYPEAAIAAGVLRNRRVIGFFSAMERLLYRQANHISLIAEGFRRNLLGKGVSPDKISLIPVWADPDMVQPLPKENAFRSAHGLNGRFVVMYAGNLGHTSALEEVLDAAEMLRGEADIRFLIVGEGVKKAELEGLAQERGLGNMLFLPFQPRQMFAEMLAAADVGLVTLNRNSSETSLPSKIFNIMASARPILAVAPAESEIAGLVDAAKCGFVTSPGHPELLADAITKMMGQAVLSGEMGRSGRAHLEARYTRGSCVEKYERMLLNLCNKEHN
jgi:colanic acid biosynthesis glycosyl transferase WcaI